MPERDEKRIESSDRITPANLMCAPCFVLEAHLRTWRTLLLRQNPCFALVDLPRSHAYYGLGLCARARARRAARWPRVRRSHAAPTATLASSRRRAGRRKRRRRAVAAQRAVRLVRAQRDGGAAEPAAGERERRWRRRRWGGGAAARAARRAGSWVAAVPKAVLSMVKRALRGRGRQGDGW